MVKIEEEEVPAFMFGVLATVQPKVDISVYQSRGAFQLYTESWIRTVANEVGLSTPKLIVFPECYGAWLVAQGEPRWLIPNTTNNNNNKKGGGGFTSTIYWSIIWMILLHPIIFWWQMISLLFFKNNSNKKPANSSPAAYAPTLNLEGCIRRCVFRMKAKDVFETYVDTFSRLAKAHNAYIVGGSAFLPRVELTQQSGASGKNKIKSSSSSSSKPILTDEGLYNVSMMFDPSGNVIGVTHKTHLIDDETTFLNAGDPDRDLCVCDTALGKVAMIICADSWYPVVYQKLRAKCQLLFRSSVDIATVSSFVSPAESWDQPWRGYSKSCGGAPSDVSKEEHDDHIARKVHESAMWEKWSLRGRIASLGAKYGIASYLVGEALPGLSGAGVSCIMDGKGTPLLEARDSRGDAILLQQIDMLSVLRDKRDTSS